MKKSDVCFVRAKLKDDYVFDAIQKGGFKILIPYKDKNIILRLMREVWFRLKLPAKRIWYNKAISKMNAKVFIVLDPLIIPDILMWIKENHADARIILDYENRADTTINPDCVGEFVEKWSYDPDDCKKYSMRLVHPSYFDVYRFDSSKTKKIKYDVLYLGRDKGRLDRILAYQKQFEKIGLKTYFHICADRSFLKFKNPIYKSVMPYSVYLEFLKRSRASLNIVREDQNSITQRELETVFDGVKCITTNKAIKQFELYDPSRYFVLGEDDIHDLKSFIEMPFLKIEEDDLNDYKFETVIWKMINKC